MLLDNEVYYYSALYFGIAMRETIKSIQFLRFVAASFVVYAHSMEVIHSAVDKRSGLSALYFAEFGAVGVHIFFVISGFIMIYTSFRGSETRRFSPYDFIVRRFIRIYPIYWIYAALYILFPIASEGYHLPAWNIVGSLMLLPGYSSKIIGPGWTLAYEIYFYICFASAMRLGLLRGLLVMTAFFFASAIIGAILRPETALLHVVTSSLLAEFIAGAWIAYFFIIGTRLRDSLSNAFILTAFIIFGVGYAYGYHRLPALLLWGLPSALLIAGLVFKERSGSLSILIKKASVLGNSSYSLYLIHLLLIAIFAPLIAMLMSSFELNVFYVSTCLALTIICIVIAVPLYDFVESRVVTTVQAMLHKRRAGLVFERDPTPVDEG